MKLKYATGINPIRGKRSGGVFQKYASGFMLTSNKKNGRHRYPFQWNSSGILIQLTRNWRNLSSSQKLKWHEFAIANPHIVNKWAGYDPLSLGILTTEEGFIITEEDSSLIASQGPDSSQYWSGYAFYLVRNYYELLFNGRDTTVFIPSDTSTVPDISPTFDIYVYFGIISLVITCTEPINPYNHGFFLTRVNSPGALFPSTTPIFMASLSVPASPDVYTKPTDLSIPFYRNFGTVPKVGDRIILKYRKISINTGNVYDSKYYELQFQAP